MEHSAADHATQCLSTCGSRPAIDPTHPSVFPVQGSSPARTRCGTDDRRMKSSRASIKAVAGLGAISFACHNPEPTPVEQAWFAGRVEYACSYSSATLNTDSLASRKWRTGAMTFSGSDYCSRYIGPHTSSYY